MGLDTSHIFQKFSALSRVNDLIVIAVSGGSDSLAMVRLYADFASSHPDAAKAHCVTINHGLRAEAANEAQFVASVCGDLCFSHKTLHWEGDKPSTHMQASARAARHQLLRQEAKTIGADSVLIGHTLDDQSETYLMRKERSDSVRGLAAMAPATLYSGDVWLARPLLNAARQDLRDYLSSKDQAWVNDPSNQDARYERVRVRFQMRDGNEAERLDAERERREDVQSAAKFVSTHFSISKKTEGVFSGASEIRHAEGASFLAMRTAMALIGARAYLPSEDASRDALSRLPDGSVTLSGCVLKLDDGALHIKREIRGSDRQQMQKEQVDSALPLFDRYLPSFDLPLANAFAPFFGRNRYPTSPLG